MVEDLRFGAQRSAYEVNQTFVRKGSRFELRGGLNGSLQHMH